MKKRDLIAFANARGAPFIDDPSNVDPRFARTRLRALLARLDEEGLDAKALDRLARRARETEEALAHLTAEVERGSVRKARSTRARCSPRRSQLRNGFWPRIAEAGGRDATPHRTREDRSWPRPRDALEERRAYGANVGVWSCGSAPKAGSVSRPSRREKAANDRRSGGNFTGCAPSGCWVIELSR